MKNTKNNHIQHWNTRGRTGTVSNNGYMVRQVYKKRMYEHRRIAERYLKRTLKANEVVHHKDGNRLNNEAVNLEIMTKEKHAGIHARERGFGKDRIGISPANKTDKKTIKEIVKLRRNKKTMREIGEQLQLSYPTVWKYCKEYNLSDIGLNRWTKRN